MRFNTTFRTELPITIKKGRAGNVTFELTGENVNLTARRTLVLNEDLTLDPNKVYVAKQLRGREFTIEEVAEA